MNESERYERNRHDEPEQNPRRDNQAVLLNGLLVLSTCLFLASLFPRDVFAMVLSAFLFAVAFGSVAAATLQGDSLFADHLTDWDIAAIALLASYVASWFVDPATVWAYVQAEGVAGAAGAANVEGRLR